MGSTPFHTSTPWWAASSGPRRQPGPAAFAYTWFWNEFWGALGNNLRTQQALTYLWMYHRDKVARNPMEGCPSQRICKDDRRFWEYRPPYFNIRVFGNPNAKLPP